MKRKRLFQAVLALFAAVSMAAAVQGPAMAVSPHAIGEVYGPYLLYDPVAAKCLDNPNSSGSNGTKPILYTCNNGISQQWNNETPVTLNDYWTFNKASHKCLTVQNGSTSNNATVIQYSCNSGTNERWTYESVSLGGTLLVGVAGNLYTVNHGYKIKNLKSSKCLAAKDASTSNNATMVQKDCSSADVRLWWQLQLL